VVRNRKVRELEVVKVNKVQTCNSPDNSYIGVTVRNNGLGDDHQFDLNITANGVPQPTVFNPVFIGPDQTIEINVFLQGLQFGSNTVAVDITNVDGQGEDEEPSNDTGEITFTISPDGFPVQLYFTPNQDQIQNTWELRDDQNNLVASGGPYPVAFGFYAEELCLVKDKCYVFHLFDTGGDGMEGGFVNLVSPSGNSYWSYFGGNFGNEVSAPFCATDACIGFQVQATTECPTPNNGKITAKVINGTAPFQFSLDGANFQSDSVFSNLVFGFYNVFCLDANGCATEVFVDLCTVNTSEPNQLRGLKVSPNPTSGMANIELPALEGEQSLICEVLDQKGKLIQTVRLVRWDNTLRGMAILDNAPAGTYFLRVKGLARPLTAKLVKQ